MRIGRHALSLTWGDICISKNKSFEYQLEFGSKFATELFEFNLTHRSKQDHAGIDFTFSVYKLFWLNLNIHDHRHWNHKANCFYPSSEELEIKSN